MGETAESTIRREFREELSAEVNVRRPLWLVENFFDYDGLRYHELGLYFLIHLPPDSRLLDARVFESTDGNKTLRFRWFPLDEEALATLPVRPSFLVTGLSRLPASVTHIVHRDLVSHT